MNNDIKYGIDGFKAHEFEVDRWVDANGKPTKRIKLSDFEGKFKIVYCFQNWCPGCHSRGLPALQEMTKALKNNETLPFWLYKRSSKVIMRILLKRYWKYKKSMALKFLLAMTQVMKILTTVQK